MLPTGVRRHHRGHPRKEEITAAPRQPQSATGWVRRLAAGESGARGFSMATAGRPTTSRGRPIVFLWAKREALRPHFPRVGRQRSMRASGCPWPTTATKSLGPPSRNILHRTWSHMVPGLRGIGPRAAPTRQASPSLAAASLPPPPSLSPLDFTLPVLCASFPAVERSADGDAIACGVPWRLQPVRTLFYLFGVYLSSAFESVAATPPLPGSSRS